MIQTLARNRSLLALCGVLEAMIAVIYFLHADSGFSSSRDITFLGQIAVLAGACTVAVGTWRSRNAKCWPLVLNGFALGALGLILCGIAGFTIRFLTIALLISLIATSIGIFQLLSARALRRKRDVANRWFLNFAGGASFGFAVAFLVLAAPTANPQHGWFTELLWLGSYFGFSATCLVILAVRLHLGQRQPLLA